MLLVLLNPVFSQNLEFENWKVQREEELLAEDGWINLIDLIWFDENLPYLNLSKNDSLTLPDRFLG